MKLYHGSNIGIDEIDLKRGRRGKDFGQGFYLSADREQAMLMARRTVDREESGTATLTTYLFDEDILQNPGTLRIKIFQGYTMEWAEFVIKNRQNKTHRQVHRYDIVVGPIADDKVGLQISRYQLRYIPMEELIRQLSFIRPTYQYFFGSQQAIDLLKKIEK